MSLSKRNRIPVMLIILILAVSPAKCAALETDPARVGACFIYTDGLLDDLCAIEYLSRYYDQAVIMLQDPGGLADSPYASGAVTDESTFFEAVSQWFTSVTPYSDPADIREADLYLLAPLTGFAELLRNEPSLSSKRALLMAGDSEGPDGAGGDWNAVMDIDAYRYVTENMTDLLQVTRPECEAGFETNGYPFHARFLDEYTARMRSMDESVCCYDLQAAALAFR